MLSRYPAGHGLDDADGLFVKVFIYTSQHLGIGHLPVFVDDKGDDDSANTIFNDNRLSFGIFFFPLVIS